jgi:hypothetical protein
MSHEGASLRSQTGTFLLMKPVAAAVCFNECRGVRAADKNLKTCQRWYGYGMIVGVLSSD